MCLPLVLEHEMMRTRTASQHPVPGPAELRDKRWRTDQEAGKRPSGQVLGSCRGHWQMEAAREPSMHGVSRKRRGGLVFYLATA